MNAFDRTSRTRKLGLAGASAGVALAAASTAQAELILSPTAFVSNSMGESTFSDLDIGNVIDQSGLSSNFTSGTTNYATYLSTPPTHATMFSGDSWQSASGNSTGSIVFDLGDLYNIERLAIWQGGASTGKFDDRHVNGITLETSLDPAFTSPTSAGLFNVPPGAGASAYPVHDFDLIDSTGRYVRLTIDSVHGPNTAFATLGEIAFDVSPATVPEPSSGLSLAIAAGTALLFRRLWRKRPA